jgi:uncharacterized protein DUF2795
MTIENPPEGPGDPELTPNPGIDPAEIGGEDSDRGRRELRAEIGKYVSLVSFPATAEDLISSAEAHDAPGQVVRLLRTLRPGAAFDNARDLWVALDLEATDRF